MPGFASDDLLNEVKVFSTQPPPKLQEILCRLQRIPAMLDETVRHIEAYARQKVDGVVEDLWVNRLTYNLQKLEFHLCDTLLDVYDRANSYWSELRAAVGEYMFLEMLFERTAGEDYLVLDAVANGFQGYRSLRRDNSDVPTLGRHRLLSTAATRQGMAKPLMSGFFPMYLWRQLNKPSQHFLLNAAERVAAEQCLPIYPDVPSPDEARQLSWEAALAEGDCGFDVEPHLAPLRRLGFETAFRRRAEQNRSLERLENDEWASDWTRVITECQSALYETDIERSLYLQNLLDLYPLQKRMLGLVETVILPKIKEKIIQRDGKLPDAAKGASGLWTVAFTGAQDETRNHTVTKNYDPLTNATLQPTWKTDGLKATLETEGNWVLHAQNHAGNGTNPIGLARLLDDIVKRITYAEEVRGLSIDLSPRDPQAHAEQLAALADCNNRNAACMTLYLGKIALMLRNAVEHGTDLVEGEVLRVDTPGYWKERRGVLDRLKEYAQDVSWRCNSSLPSDLPSVANSFVLTPASLKRCLVLLSLVLHGAFSHLGLRGACQTCIR
jgi:hypothetical protein